MRRRHAQAVDGASTSASVQEAEHSGKGKSVTVSSRVNVLTYSLVLLSVGASLYLHSIPFRITWSLLNETDKLGSMLPDDLAVDYDGDFLTPRDNVTVQIALEAAVMGSFLADAASLGLQG